MSTLGGDQTPFNMYSKALEIESTSQPLYRNEEIYFQEVLSKIKNSKSPQFSEFNIVFDKLINLSYQDIYSLKKVNFDYFHMFFNLLLESSILSVTESSSNRNLHLLLLKKLNALLYSSALIQNYCCNDKWITKLLNYLISSSKHDSDIIGEVSVCLQILCYFNITPKEFKFFIKLLESINDERPYWWNVLVEVLEYMFKKRDGPDTFFNFSNASSGLMVPQRQAFDGGYSISFWINTEDFTNFKFKPSLYSFFSDDDVGFECCFYLQSLVFSIKTKTKAPIIKSVYKFQPHKWYHVTIAHEYFLLRKSQLSLYVNGRLEEKMPLLYPKSDKPFTRCHVGNSMSMTNAFIGRMGSILMVQEAFTPVEAAHIYSLGKDATLIYEKIPREGTTGIFNGELFLETGKRNIKIIFLYHPKATDKALCFEISTGELPNASTIMEGVSIIKTTSPIDQLINIGGIKMIYPLFGQIGQNISGMQIEAAEINELTSIACGDVDFVSIPHSHAPTPIFPSSLGSGHIGSLLKVLLSLLEHQPIFREQIIETHGFQTISMLLKSMPSSAPYWTPEDIDILGRLISFTSTNLQLWQIATQHLLLNNFQLWCETHSLTQICLFETIRQRVQNNTHFWRNNVRVDQWLQILKKYYVLPSQKEQQLINSSPKVSTLEIYRDVSKLERIKKSRSQIIVILRETSSPMFSQAESRWIALYLKESTLENQEDVVRMLEDMIPPQQQNTDTWWEDVLSSVSAYDENLINKSRNDFLSVQMKLPKHISYLWDIDCGEEIMKRNNDKFLEKRNQYLLFKNWIKIRRNRAGNLNGIKIQNINVNNNIFNSIFYKLKELGIDYNNNDNSNLNNNSNNNNNSMKQTPTSPNESPVISPSSSPPKNNIGIKTTTTTTTTTTTNIVEPEDTRTIFWKLDKTEGPSRMRRKLKRNYLGSDYRGLNKQNRFGRNRRIIADTFETDNQTYYIDQDCGDGLGNLVFSIQSDKLISPNTTLFKEMEFLKELQNSNAVISNSSNILFHQLSISGGNYLLNSSTISNNSNTITTNGGPEFNSSSSSPTFLKSPSKQNIFSNSSTPSTTNNSTPNSSLTNSSNNSLNNNNILSPNNNQNNQNNNQNNNPDNNQNNNIEVEPEKLIGLYNCLLITPVGAINGKLTLTNYYLTFDKEIKYDKAGVKIPDPDYGSIVIKNTFNWRIRDLVEIHKARYLLRWNSIEIFLNHKSYMLSFSTENESNVIFNKIVSLHPPNLKVKWSEHPSKIIKKTKLVMKWKNREISNFEYLMALNTIAGRTYNDISQYPIFPQIIADYKSSTLDLKDASSFRDLTKPIGALNQQRLDTLLARYNSFNDPQMPAFLYGSHYSNFGIVAYYQVRLEPFTSCHLSLQSGVFDHPQRMFESMPRMWEGVTSANLADVKELIPEFFYMPEFITNINNFNFNFQTSPAGDLILPPWANDSSEEFIRKNREALESEYVSANINHWIDLIFGYKQNGVHSVEANNVFFHLTYENNQALQRDDPDERNSINSQIREFGQTPSQIFTKPHPKRKTLEELQKTPKDLFSRITNLFPSSNNNNNNNNNIDIGTSPTLSSSTQYPFKILKTNSKLPLVHIGSCQDSEIIVLVYRDGVLAVNQFDPSPSNGLPFTFDIDKSLSTYREKQIDTLFMSDSVTCISNCFILTPDGKYMFSCATWDSIFKCSNIQNGKIHRMYRNFHQGMVTCMGLGSSGKTLATGSSDTTILVWQDCASLLRDSRAKPSYRLCSHDEAVQCLDISEEWDLIASGSQDRKCILHNLRKGTFIRSMVHRGAVEMVKISTVCQSVITYCSMSFLYIHSFNGKLLAMVPCDEKLYDIKLTGEVVVKKGGVFGVGDSNQYIITGGAKGVKIRSLPDLSIVHSFDSPTTIKSIALVAQEKFLMIGLNDDSEDNEDRRDDQGEEEDTDNSKAKVFSSKIAEILKNNSNFESWIAEYISQSLGFVEAVNNRNNNIDPEWATIAVEKHISGLCKYYFEGKTADRQGIHLSSSP
ncbi:hypothetical protein CYY_006757 [Polysphondylium violaceum]|uniref:BEACH domain-containing protein n=1 Tax=Polysphondylium violaceum TaxID=133409 RepID=A0A8J4PPN5_9MYCE|nr:hypothetical protein CYY_006757 [Polysphondylium violaceum]